MVIDSGYVVDAEFRGGRLGVLVFSQKEIVFSNLQYKCNGELSSFLSFFFFVFLFSIDALTALIFFYYNFFSYKKQQKIADGSINSSIQYCFFFLEP